MADDLRIPADLLPADGRFGAGPSKIRVEALDALAAAGRVESFGRGRARRWIVPPVPRFTTALSLSPPGATD